MPVPCVTRNKFERDVRHHRKANFGVFDSFLYFVNLEVIVELAKNFLTNTFLHGPSCYSALLPPVKTICPHHAQSVLLTRELRLPVNSKRAQPGRIVGSDDSCIHYSSVEHVPIGEFPYFRSERVVVAVVEVEAD